MRLACAVDPLVDGVFDWPAIVQGSAGAHVKVDTALVEYHGRKRNVPWVRCLQARGSGGVLVLQRYSVP